jgi:hypothetical protein
MLIEFIPLLIFTRTIMTLSFDNVRIYLELGKNMLATHLMTNRDRGANMINILQFQRSLLEYFDDVED